MKMLQDKFPTVFDNNFSSIKDFESHSHVLPDAVPCFSKPYDVPYASLDAFKKELNAHIKDKILISVKYSKWASPLVPVPIEGGG
jgi:hypothetical protein